MLKIFLHIVIVMHECFLEITPNKNTLKYFRQSNIRVIAGNNKHNSNNYSCTDYISHVIFQYGHDTIMTVQQYQREQQHHYVPLPLQCD